MTLILDRFPARGRKAGDLSARPPGASPSGRGGWSEKLPRRNSALVRASLACAAGLIELFVAVATALICEAAYHGFVYGGNGLTSSNLQLCLLAAVFFVLSNAMRGDYRIADYLALRRRGWRLLAVWSVSFLLALAFGFLTKSTEESSRAGVVLFYVTGYFTIYVMRLLLLTVARGATSAGGVASRRVFLVGFEENIEAFTYRCKPRTCGMHVVAAIGLRDDAATLDEDLALAAATARMLRPDDVFILAPWSRTQTIESCVTAFLRVPAQIHLGPEKVLDRFVDARVDKIGSVSSLKLGGHPLNLLEVIAKRAFDLIVASLALTLLSPVLLLVALLIRLESRGPALFLQRRYGFNQEPFRNLEISLDDDAGRWTRCHSGDGGRSANYAGGPISPSLQCRRTATAHQCAPGRYVAGWTASSRVGA